MSILLALLASPYVQAEDCETLMGKVDATIGDASDRDPELVKYVTELRAEAAAHLGNGDPASCEAAISQALDLLAVQ
jgi:hypothetical protein